MNAINWFEIPSTDFDRAVKFYENLLQIQLKRILFEGTTPNAFFPYAETGIGGAVVDAPYAKPSVDGAVVYLNAQNMTILDEALNRTESLGGRIVMPKTNIGEVGYFALIIDSEGNRVGLHIPAQS